MVPGFVLIPVVTLPAPTEPAATIPFRRVLFLHDLGRRPRRLQVEVILPCLTTQSEAILAKPAGRKHPHSESECGRNGHWSGRDLCRRSCRPRPTTDPLLRHLYQRVAGRLAMAAAVPHRDRCHRSNGRLFCAEQRIVREGSSPSGARMRGAISKSGDNTSLAGERWKVWRSLNGHEGESRTQAKADLKPSFAVLRRAGCPSRGGIRRA